MSAPVITSAKYLPISALNSGGGETTSLSGKNKIIQLQTESYFNSFAPALMDTWSYQFLMDNYGFFPDRDTWSATVSVKDCVMLWNRNALLNIFSTLGLQSGLNLYSMPDLENVSLFYLDYAISDPIYALVIGFD